MGLGLLCAGNSPTNHHTLNYMTSTLLYTVGNFPYCNFNMNTSSYFNPHRLDNFDNENVESDVEHNEESIENLLEMGVLYIPGVFLLRLRSRSLIKFNHFFLWLSPTYTKKFRKIRSSV